MVKVRVEIDDSQVQAVFKALDLKKQKRVLKQGLKKSANILVKRARRILAQKVKNTNKPNRWNGRTLKSGIKAWVHSENEAKVNIMGDFRLRIFEVGNFRHSPRMTQDKKDRNGHFRKSHSTGNIDRSKFHFFDTAKTLSEREVFDSLNQNIKLSIQNAILKGKNRYV